MNAFAAASRAGAMQRKQMNERFDLTFGGSQSKPAESEPPPSQPDHEEPEPIYREPEAIAPEAPVESFGGASHDADVADVSIDELVAAAQASVQDEPPAPAPAPLPPRAPAPERAPSPKAAPQANGSGAEPHPAGVNGANGHAAPPAAEKGPVQRGPAIMRMPDRPVEPQSTKSHKFVLRPNIPLNFKPKMNDFNIEMPEPEPQPEQQGEESPDGKYAANGLLKQKPVKTGKYRFKGDDIADDDGLKTDGSELGVVNKNFHSDYVPDRFKLHDVGTPEELEIELAKVGYQCMPFYAVQMALLMNTPWNSVKAMLLEGPPGCGKSFMAKSLAKITGAELMCLQCYRGMQLDHLIEKPSTMAMVNAMSGKGATQEELMQLGIISRAFLASQTKPVILLIDEIDKCDGAIDTFFLGPIQDARVWLESRPPIDCNVDNLLILFTKNFERILNDALLRRLHPLRMTYMDAELEKKVLAPHCVPALVNNLVRIADIMRYTEGSYPFDRPPAPEELLKAAKYINLMLNWDLIDFSFVGKNVFYILAKSEHDRTIFEQMLRYHPDFFDPLVPDGKNAHIDEIYARLGRTLLEGIVDDPDAVRRGKAYKPEKVGLTKFDNPEELARRLSDVGYQCMDFVASQMTLLLTTYSDRTRAVLLEGPSGCGKSFMAKCLAKISGADFMCMSCYSDMNTSHLIEQPSTLALAAAATGKEQSKEKLMNLGILSRAYLKSQNQPVILLIDEIDKVGPHIDTFFLGPIQDARIWLESRPPIDCNIDNLLLIFTKNFNRVLDDALLRRLHPIKMSYLDSTLERKVLSKHCLPQLVANLVSVADRMRNSGGSYQFERPPAPEELVTAGLYILRQLEWGHTDFAVVGRSVWAILAKSEHDRAVMEHMMRFHPDFIDPLHMDGRNSPMEVIYASLGRVVLNQIVEDPDTDKREKAWLEMENY